MPLKGYKQTEEHIKKISNALKKRFKDKTKHPLYGKICSEETKEKISMANSGKNRTEETKRKLSIAKIGHRVSEKTKAKISQSNMGKAGWNKGRIWSDETKLKMSIAKKGKIFSEEHRKNLSLSHKGKPAHNKGIPMSKEQKLKMSKILKGKPAWNKGKSSSDEARQKLRLAILKQIKRRTGKGSPLVPFYNERACEYFKQFDEINKTKGQYATNGGERCILGYWLDYINHSKKIIIEWDEEAHYVNGKLKEKDMIRQKEIEAHFPDYTFIRIREAEYIPKANELFPRLVENGI